MERRKKAPSGERRRRVLRDDRSRNATSRSTTKRAKPKPQLYVTDAATELQPRLTELIPHRKRALIAYLVVGLLIVGSLQLLYLIRRSLLASLPPSSTMPLHLMGAGTLSAWCGSLLLAFSSLVSLVIFSIRRHKVDDYHGRFGMWLTVSLACLVASADTSTGMHAMFNAGMFHLTGYAPFGSQGAWWTIAGNLLGIYLVVRVAADAWRSRGTVIATFATIAIYGLSSLFFYRRVRLGTDHQDTMAYTGLLMLGHVMLALTMLTYARYVYREAAGILGKKKRKKRTRKKTTRSTTSQSGWFSQLFLRGPADSSEGSRTKKRTAGKQAVSRPKNDSSQWEEHETSEPVQHTQPPSQSEKRAASNPTQESAERPLGKKARKRLKNQRRAA